MDRLLEIYVVYWNPKDCPGHYVVRMHSVDDKGRVFADPRALGFKTLEAARKAIPPDKVLMQPMPGDDPVIYETWI